jgi:hypothetical protein
VKLTLRARGLGHMLRKSFCFSMRRENVLWGHFLAKSIEKSTNGSIRSESRLRDRLFFLIILWTDKELFPLHRRCR